MQRTGIFAGLRRRRWALSLAFGYALLLNALLGTSVEAAVAASLPDPLVAASAHCSPLVPAPQAPHHGPADHQQTCPLCGPACPMTGGAPVPLGAGLVAFATPREAPSTTTAWPRRKTSGGRSLYASDTDSQGPPAA